MKTKKLSTIDKTRLLVKLAGVAILLAVASGSDAAPAQKNAKKPAKTTTKTEKAPIKPSEMDLTAFAEWLKMNPVDTTAESHWYNRIDADPTLDKPAK